MNPLTQFKKIPILPLLIALALFVVAPALATPPIGVTSTPISDGTFDEIDVHSKVGHWKAKIDTRGDSHLFLVQNTVVPGGTFGWHSHPGPSLVIVVSGAAMEYEGDDPTCTPNVHPQGSTFVDSGGGSGHLVRNEGNVNLVVVVARLVPEGAAQRDDLPNPRPGICPE
jgi:quercetin dioxygenase-like cupin family protein